MQQESYARRRRFMSLVLPRWPTDRWRRSAPSPDEAAGRPVALYHKEKGALRLYAVDRAAIEAGLHRGQALSDARALAPSLFVAPADILAQDKDFLALCAAHGRYSPLVFPHENRDIVIDIAGAAHLFGGEAAMLDEALRRLGAMGVEARGAIADTQGASLALAYCRIRTIVPSGEERAALEPLPVATLRLDAGIVASLKQLGLKKIGQLYRAPRAPLAARFGASLSARLDQALGRLPEAMTPIFPAPLYEAAQKLAEPISSQEAITAWLETLCGCLCETLENAGKGGRRFILLLYRVDHAVTRLEVRTAAPTRAPDHLLRLFSNRLQDATSDLDAGFGFELLRLGAHDCEALALRQGEALGRGDDRADEAGFVDRVANRLGGANVVRLAPRDSHLPERAVGFESALGARAPANFPALFQDGESAPRRPLKLLERPEAIEVMALAPDGPPARFRWRRVSYRVAKASPPERIEDEWWRPRARAARDYYRVETVEGWRFWVFRAGFYGADDDGPKWYLHGFFP